MRIHFYFFLLKAYHALCKTVCKNIFLLTILLKFDLRNKVSEAVLSSDKIIEEVIFALGLCGYGNDHCLCTGRACVRQILRNYFSLSKNKHAWSVFRLHYPHKCHTELDKIGAWCWMLEPETSLAVSLLIVTHVKFITDFHRFHTVTDIFIFVVVNN